jgi:excisionase family DNA binding protein
MIELARAASPWLTPSEAAQYLGFGRRTIERAIGLGVLPAKWLRGERLIAAEDARLFRTNLIELARAEGLNHGPR